MVMRIAICDDNLEYINIVENYLDKINQDRKNIDYDVFMDGTELVHMYENNMGTYDAIFLDMEMKEMNGIETANFIRQFDEYVIIVFITGYSSYMQKSFECSPFRFLVKPIDFNDVKKVYEEILTKLNKYPKTLVFVEDGIHIRLHYKDIVFCESHSHYILINTKEKQYKIRKTMNELHNAFGQTMFFRVHKSYVVNLEYIKEIGKTNVILYGYNKKIPISRNYRKSFIEAFIHYEERKHLI